MSGGWYPTKNRAGSVHDQNPMLHPAGFGWLAPPAIGIDLHNCKSKRQEGITGLVQPRIALMLLRFAQSVKAILFSLGRVDSLKGLMQICLCGLVIERMPDVRIA